MKTKNNIKIAYIGGGSRGWAWSLMSDLARAEDISGEVRLYDIDFQAAKNNEIIGNNIRNCAECKSIWDYKAVESIEEALKGVDFVIISILPGTFYEMHSDVHTPEKYEIYQSVGDTTGPGGIIRALRTIPMFQTIAKAIKEFAPDAWVINYTNPMAVCVRTLYETFPDIKAFGCCHEIFGVQELLALALEKVCGIKDVKREEIKVNIVGVNHFTWITSAFYERMDLFPIYKKFIKFCEDTSFVFPSKEHWMNRMFSSQHKVKFDLFKRYGYIAAAGDRHLAEFCPKNWYLNNPEQVKMWEFGLTPVDWRIQDLQNRLNKSKRLLDGEEMFELEPSGEEGVNQIRALLGLEDLVTNVNIPNKGQIPNLPLGAVVETNACFRSSSLEPVFAGSIPKDIYPLIATIVGEQELVVNGTLTGDMSKVFRAFVNSPLLDIPISDAEALFAEMIQNTKS